MPYSRVSVGCQEGVRGGVWGCLSASVYFLDSFLSAASFSHICLIGQNMLYFGVSVGCLGGVWGLSELLWILSGGV